MMNRCRMSRRRHHGAPEARSEWLRCCEWCKAAGAPSATLPFACSCTGTGIPPIVFAESLESPVGVYISY